MRTWTICILAGLIAVAVATPRAAAQSGPAGETGPDSSATTPLLDMAMKLWQEPADDEPQFFQPIFFRPPVPFLKVDDRFETFVNSETIQKELEHLEKVLLNPFGTLGKDLSSGIRYERDAQGRLVQRVQFGGNFEFSASSNQQGFYDDRSRGYDYDSWLNSAQDQVDRPDD